MEQYVDLRLTVTKTLPASLIDTTLNLPPGEPEVHLAAHLADVPIPAHLGNVNTESIMKAMRCKPLNMD